MELRPFSRHHHLLWITVLVLLAMGTLLLAACGSTSTTDSTSTPTATTAQSASTSTTAPTATPTPAIAGAGTTVSIVENEGVYAFSPGTLTIAKGTTVTWTNMTAAPHTVISDTNAFTASAHLAQNDTFQTTFTTAGTFTYHCAIHTYMKATIIVTA